MAANKKRIQRKIFVCNFSKRSKKAAKRYIERFKARIFINYNSDANDYHKSLVSAFKRINYGN